MRLTVVVAAYAWQSTAALPFGTIVIIMLIWSAITIPLTVFGGIAGKNHQVLHPAAVHCNTCDQCLHAQSVLGLAASP